MPVGNYYRKLFARVSPPVLRGRQFGERLSGIAALVFDALADTALQSVRAHWIGDRTLGPAHDALGPAGREMGLPRYPVETWTQHHDRLQRAWQDWVFAGDESSILGQLTAAGFPGAHIVTARQWPAVPPTPWWSQFWVVFPVGTHNVTGAGEVYGSFSWGDGTHYGVQGLTQAEILTLKSIVLQFKPAHWVCRSILFELTPAWEWGDGSEYGDVGLVWGGTYARVEI